MSKTQQSTIDKKPRAAANNKTEGLSDFEKEALKARVAEIKKDASRKKSGKQDGEQDVMAKLAEMKDPAMGKRLHELIKANAPNLSPKTWYGMPAYANADGKVVIFFRPAERFKERYLTFGFNQEANLDEGKLWPIAYAITGLTQKEEDQIAALVRSAVS